MDKFASVYAENGLWKQARTLQRKVDCQIPGDPAAVLSAVNFGRPLPEVAPNSAIVKALKPLVAAFEAPADAKVASATGLLGKLGQKFPSGFRKK